MGIRKKVDVNTHNNYTAKQRKPSRRCRCCIFILELYLSSVISGFFRLREEDELCKLDLVSLYCSCIEFGQSIVEGEKRTVLLYVSILILPWSRDQIAGRYIAGVRY